MVIVFSSIGSEMIFIAMKFNTLNLKLCKLILLVYELISWTACTATFNEYRASFVRNIDSSHQRHPLAPTEATEIETERSISPARKSHSHVCEPENYHRSLIWLVGGFGFRSRISTSNSQPVPEASQSYYVIIDDADASCADGSHQPATRVQLSSEQQVCRSALRQSQGRFRGVTTNDDASSGRKWNEATAKAGRRRQWRQRRRIVRGLFISGV